MILIWLIVLVFVIILIWLPLKKSANYRHEEIRKEASKRVIDAEKNLNRERPSQVNQQYRHKTIFEILDDERNVKIPEQSGKRKIGYVALEFRYRDQEGCVTNRRARISSYSAKSKKVTAWCELRRDMRTFYTDRMFDVVDPSTGECISDVNEFLRLNR